MTEAQGDEIIRMLEGIAQINLGILCGITLLAFCAGWHFWVGR